MPTFYKISGEDLNLNLLNEDVNKDNLSSYASCLVEAINTLNRMLAFLAPTDPDVIGSYQETKKELAEGLENSISSHLSLWSGLKSMSSLLQDTIRTSEQWKVDKSDDKEIQERLKDLEARYEDGSISKQDYSKELDKIKAEAKVFSAKDIFLERTKSAFKLFDAAVKSFAQGGETLLKASKEKKPDWLENATLTAKQALNKNS